MKESEQLVGRFAAAAAAASVISLATHQWDFGAILRSYRAISLVNYFSCECSGFSQTFILVHIYYIGRSLRVVFVCVCVNASWISMWFQVRVLYVIRIYIKNSYESALSTGMFSWRSWMCAKFQWQNENEFRYTLRKNRGKFGSALISWLVFLFVKTPIFLSWNSTCQWIYQIYDKMPILWACERASVLRVQTSGANIVRVLTVWHYTMWLNKSLNWFSIACTACACKNT